MQGKTKFRHRPLQGHRPLQRHLVCGMLRALSLSSNRSAIILCAIQQCISSFIATCYHWLIRFARTEISITMAFLLLVGRYRMRGGALQFQKPQIL